MNILANLGLAATAPPLQAELALDPGDRGDLLLTGEVDEQDGSLVTLLAPEENLIKTALPAEHRTTLHTALHTAHCTLHTALHT